MKNNFNQRERLIRLFLSILTGGLGFSGYFEDTLLRSAFVFLSVVLLFTVVVNFCPIYRFLGVSTNKSRRMTY